MPAVQGASVFVNPLTVVGFVDTMRSEGHSAIVHTAAGSQLGRMLVKYCKAEGVPLVNIVRSEAAVAGLTEIGAENIVNSSAETYKADLLAACAATGATIGFDATGGGTLATEIIQAMEGALKINGTGVIHPAYGNNTHKQVYRYGGLQPGNTEIGAVSLIFPPSSHTSLISLISLSFISRFSMIFTQAPWAWRGALVAG